MRAMRFGLAVILGFAAVISGCTDHDARIDSRVESVSPDEICVVPRDPSLSTVATGCYPISEETVRLSPGDCISAITPYGKIGPLDEPLRSVRVLDGGCDR